MYKHLSREERYQNQILVRAQHSTTEIARIVGRHPAPLAVRSSVALAPRVTEPNKPAAKRLSEPATAAMPKPLPPVFKRIEPYIR
jgi:hypothetical protein